MSPCQRQRQRQRQRPAQFPLAAATVTVTVTIPSSSAASATSTSAAQSSVLQSLVDSISRVYTTPQCNQRSQEMMMQRTRLTPHDILEYSRESNYVYIHGIEV
jgi:hypothetical protein